MKMHLSEEQFEQVISGSQAEADAAAHLTECAECAAEAERMRAALREFAASARMAGERPEGFWTRQCQAIAARLGESGTPSRGLQWAVSLAAVVLLALTLVPRTPPRVEQDPDDALLRDVQRSLRRQVPQALEPAALLAQELDRAAQNAEKKATADERR